MPPQFKSFRVSCSGPEEQEQELNRFLRSVRVLTVSRDFVCDGQNSYAFFTVEYLDGGVGKSPAPSGRSRVDYKEVLSAEDFALYARIRDWRKDEAGKKAVPVFTIFTNEQMAKIAQVRPTSKNALQKIDGIGEAKTSAYGDAVLEIVAGQPPATGDIDR